MGASESTARLSNNIRKITMGASESTARSNGTNEEEKPQQENNSSVGDAIAAATVVATVAAGAAGVVWGISKMLSNNMETEETNRHVTEPSLVNTSRIVYEAHGPLSCSIWSPPPEGRFKMNTDGACHPMRLDGGVQRGPSGYGGILRDHYGNWVLGFIGFIGDQSDCFTSELHGILRGLELLDKYNYKQAILETDSQAAYQFVTGHDEYRRQKEIVRESWPIIEKCRQLAEKNGISFNLVPGKNANQCADKLADMAIERRSAYVELKYLPRELIYLVEKDV